MILQISLLLGFIFLQATSEIDSGIIGTIVENIIAVGFTGTFAIAMFVLWWKERARASKERNRWNDQLVKDKNLTQSQVDGLYREIKDGNRAENEKYVTIIQKQNEIQEHTVKALQDNTEVVKSNTKIMSENMGIMNKHMNTYEKFVEMLVKKNI